MIAAALLALPPAALPAAVTRLAERWEMCGHWSGEEPYDAPRRREIERAVRVLRCDRLDQDERRWRCGALTA